MNFKLLRPSGRSFIIAIAILTFASSCKKELKAGGGEVPPAPVAPTRAELTKDSIYLYAKQTYYWNEGMPSYELFAPRGYSSNTAVLDAIRGLSSPGKPRWTTANDPVPKEKYSFLDDGSVSAGLGGVSGDYGLSVTYSTTTDLRVKYVSPNSSAATAGLRRGFKITKVNDRAELTYDNGPNLSFVNEAFFGNNASVRISAQLPDGSIKDYTISRTTYNNNPILHTSVIDLGSKKVGYLVYNSFTTNSRTNLETAIGQMASSGATELVVDLRYNGGGSVATADVLTNLIAPANENGKVMYTTFWTSTMQIGKADILANQPLLDGNGKLQLGNYRSNGKWATYADIDYSPTADAGNQEKFAKLGTAAFTKVYFLVLSGTASASELVINNLKPVMDVKIIGRKTYGKPVGFFAIQIDKLDLYIPQFETKNRNNQGGYYDGMAVDYDIADDVTKDFGDKTEALLAAALNYSTKGTFSAARAGNSVSAASGRFSVSEEKQLLEKLEKDKFRGMIEDHKKFKLLQR